MTDADHDRLLALADRLDALDKHFGVHDEGCATQWEKYANCDECDCGLDEARAALPQLVVGVRLLHRDLVAAQADAAAAHREADASNRENARLQAALEESTRTADQWRAELDDLTAKGE